MPEMTFGAMRAEAKKQGFEPIPKGTYNFRVEAAELKPGKGSQQISTKIVIMDGPLAGRNTLNRLVPVKNDGDTNGMFFRQCSILGVGDDHPIWGQIDAVGLDQGLGLLAPLLIGGMFIGEIDWQDWLGEARDNVKSMKPYGGVPTGVPLTAVPVPGAVPGAVPTAPVAPIPAPLVAVPVPVPVPVPVSVPVPAAVVPVAGPVPVPDPETPNVVTQTPIPEPVPAAATAPVEAVPPVVPESAVPPQPPSPTPTPVAVVPPALVPVAPPAPVPVEQPVAQPPPLPEAAPDDAPF